MFSDIEIEESARKTLGLDEEPDKETPKFYLDAFKEYMKKCPHDNHFIIELADPKKTGGEIGGNGFGVITCMEDYCWKDIILSADPHRSDGGRADGFGSFSDFQGIDDRINPFASSSSLPSSSARPSRPPQHLANSLGTSSFSTSGIAKPSSSSILNEPFLAGPSSSSGRMFSMPTPSKSTYRESKPVIPPSSSPSRSIFDLDDGPSQPHASSSFFTRDRGKSIDVITIDSSSGVPSDDENINPLAVDSDDDDDDEVLFLADDEIPLEHKKVTNKDNPVALDDSDSDGDGDVTIKDRGKGKAVARITDSARKPLAPIFNMSQSNTQQQANGVQMVRDDSGDSLTARQNSFDALFNNANGADKGKKKSHNTENQVSALSAEEKIKLLDLMDEVARPASPAPPSQIYHESKPNVPR
uniref:Uncharacterized protein n=1 Tax=Kwoniella dejecticola CBS 10117 TaxID=1296121 RepID=A0A1A6A846_9TREE|nr:uncharacterized protein I303_03947 [Kwoniella dejecticola CBS 10117]OBR86227.1 hypothetical protein I303_03947 [Kwoniella dejecticola CBS 10117]